MSVNVLLCSSIEYGPLLHDGLCQFLFIMLNIIFKNSAVIITSCHMEKAFYVVFRLLSRLNMFLRIVSLGREREGESFFPALYYLFHPRLVSAINCDTSFML